MANGNTPSRFGGGLFGLDAIPAMSEEEFLRQRRSRISGNAAAEGAALAPDPRYKAAFANLYRGGAALGGLTRDKFVPGANSDEERAFQIREAGMEAFNARLEEMGDEADQIPADKKQHLLMIDMANAALAAGDMQAFSRISTAAAEQDQRRRLIEAQIAELEGKANPAPDLLGAAGEIWSPTEVAAENNTRLAFRKQVEMVDNIAGVFEDLQEQNLDPNVAMRQPGTLITLTNELKNTVGALLNAAGHAITGSNFENVDPEMRREEGDSTWADVVNRIRVPDTFVGARERSIYKAAVIQLAYAAWQQMEGSGSRQASNQDIIMALDSIGANTGDFKTMLATLVNNTEGGAIALQERARSQYLRGTTGNLPPEFVDRYFGGSIEPHLRRFNEVSQKVYGVIGRPQRQEDPNTMNVGGATIIFQE